MHTMMNSADSTAFTSMEFTERIARLQQHLRTQAIDLAILNENSDLYYYTGSISPLYLFVPAVGEPIMLARKAITRVEQEVTHLPLAPFTSTKDLTAILTSRGLLTARRLAFTLDSAAYATVTRFQRLFPAAETVDLSWAIRTLRMVKSSAEIAVLQRAGVVMQRVPELVHTLFHPGITELELGAALEYDFRLHGHGALIRLRREGVEMSAFGVCTSGVNSLTGTKFDGICGGRGLSGAVPFGATRDVIARGAPVVLDFAFTLDGYHLDQTRMCCWGEPSTAVTDAFQAMLTVEEAIMRDLVPGTSWDAVYLQAVALAEELGYADTVMGMGSERVKFVGHGVGLELDEPPFLAPGMPLPLAEGMTLAIEPKVALPGIGVVGIEDTVVIGPNGADRFTICEREMIVVE
jgi:Xaa-Pro aminopeptidase